MVYVKYLGPTNTRGARIQLKTYDLLEKKAKTKILHYDYSCSGALDQSMKHLEAQGLTIKAINTRNPDQDFILTEWDFEKLRAIFGMKGE